MAFTTLLCLQKFKTVDIIHGFPKIHNYTFYGFHTTQMYIHTFTSSTWCNVRSPDVAALEILMMKAQPPPEADYIMAYQKCKCAINVVSKLGHHLSSPTSSELLQGLFGLLGELIRSNNGYVMCMIHSMCLYVCRE